MGSMAGMERSSFGDSVYPLVLAGSIFPQSSLKASVTEYEPLSVGQMGVTKQLEGVAKQQGDSDRKLVVPGDIVINSRSDRRGASGLSRLTGLVSVVYTVLKPLREYVIPEFAEYLLKSKAFQDEYFRWGTGIVDDLWSTRYDRFASIRLPLPPLDTQRRIADYLDAETTQIDTLVAELNGYVELLEKRKDQLVKSVIEESDFELAPLFSLGSIQSGDIISRDDITESGDVPVYGGNGLRGYCSSANQNEDKVLIGRQGALCGNVHLARAPFFASEHALVFTPHVEVSVEWLEHVLRYMNLGNLSQASAQPGINGGEVIRQRLPLVSLEQQEEAVIAIEQELTQTDTIITQCRELKELLLKRRQVLITDVVTGKVEV